MPLPDDITSLRLTGYLREETAAGFRTPIFRGLSGQLFSCEAKPSGIIEQFLPLPKELESGVRELDKLKRRKRFLFQSMHDEAPLICIESEGVIIQPVSSARNWLLAAALRQDTEPYLKVMYGSVLSLPVSIVSNNYRLLSFPFSGPDWEHRQANLYNLQKADFLGEEQMRLRSGRIEQSETRVLSLLQSKHARDLSQQPLYNFGKKPEKVYKSQIYDSEEHGPQVVTEICDSLSLYFFSWQSLSDNTPAGEAEAVRGFFKSLGILDRVNKVAKGAKYRSLIKLSQDLIFWVYASLILFRAMRTVRKQRMVSTLSTCFSAMLKTLDSHQEYLCAERRFAIIDSTLHQLDRRNQLERGDAFWGKLYRKGNSKWLKNARSVDFEIKEGLSSYQISRSDSASSGEIFRAERISEEKYVTTRGDKYVENTLHVYFPITDYKNKNKIVLLASNSWLIIIAGDKTLTALLAGGENQKALKHRLGLARLEVVPQSASGIHFLHNFVNNTWKSLTVDGNNQSDYIWITFDKEDIEIKELARFVGFSRALQVVSERHEPLAALMPKIHFRVRSGRLHKIVDREEQLRIYLRDRLEYKSNILLDEIKSDLATLEKEEFLMPLPEEKNSNGNVTVFELSQFARQLTGSTIILAEAEIDIQAA